MYTIMNVIYGAPITKEISDKLYGEDGKDEAREELFVEFYHGGSPWPPGFCGVFLAEADECDDVMVKKLRLMPTDEERAEAEEKIARLPDDIKEILPEIGVWIVWSTS